MTYITLILNFIKNNYKIFLALLVCLSFFLTFKYGQITERNKIKKDNVVYIEKKKEEENKEQKEQINDFYENELKNKEKELKELKEYNKKMQEINKILKNENSVLNKKECTMSQNEVKAFNEFIK